MLELLIINHELLLFTKIQKGGIQNEQNMERKR